MARTGVEVTTAISAGRRNTGVPSARYHIVGVTARGPVGVAQRVTSPAEFTSLFGGRSSKSEKMYNEARSFFAEGGAELYVTRVVGPAATKGFVILEDSAAVPTVRVELNEPGSYSAQTTIQVTAGSGNTFNFSVFQEGMLKVRMVGIASPADLLARTLGHPLIKVTDLGSTSAAPANNPAVMATPEPMSEGVDDFVNITTAHYVAAMNAVGDTTRGGAIGVPDLPADIIGEDLLDHAVEYQKVALMAGDLETTQAEIKAIAQTFSTHDGASYGAIFWPYVILPDENNGGARYVSPTGYAAAARARAHTNTGYWQIPAGERSASNAITGLYTPVDTRRNNDLADAYVSGVIQDAGRVKVYNWWSLSPDRENFQYLSVRDELNNIAMDLASEFREFIFSTWDTKGKLMNQISSAAKGIMATLAERDAVSAKYNEATGEQIDSGYVINVDAPTGLGAEQNVILVRVEVRTPQTAQLILAEVVRVPLDTVL